MEKPKIEIPDDVYEHLCTEAAQLGISVGEVALHNLQTYLSTLPAPSREDRQGVE